MSDKQIMCIIPEEKKKRLDIFCSGAGISKSRVIRMGIDLVMAKYGSGEVKVPSDEFVQIQVRREDLDGLLEKVR